VGLNHLRRIKIGGFFCKIALRRDRATLVVIFVSFVRLYEDHSTDRHYVAICKGYLFGNIYWSVLLVFSSLLVSAVMFHASVSEQTPDTPVSLAVLLTAVSRKVVGRNVHATIPKGNMGYDQYSVRND